MINKSFARLVLVGLLGVPFACGGRAQAPGPNQCAAVAWGGWDATPDCAGIASIVIPPEYRGCQVDQDCSLVGVTQCSAHAANAYGASRLGNNPPPCTLPAIGRLCYPVHFAASCQQGCCVPVKQ